MANFSRGMDSFCGEKFWDWELTWETDNPDLTLCFQNTALLWFACAFLWVFSVFEAYYLHKSIQRDIPWSALSVVKCIINIFLLAIQVADFGYAIDQRNKQEIFPVDFFTPVIRFLTLLLALCLTLLDKRRGIRSSGILFMFWLLMACVGAVTYRTLINKAISEDSVEEVFPFVTYMIYYPLILGMLLLNCWADQEPRVKPHDEKSEHPCPEEASSYLSRITFFWFEKMAWKGYKKPLETADLWELNMDDKSKNVVPDFDKYWEKSLNKAKIVTPTPSVTKASFSKNATSVDFAGSKRPQKRPVSILPTLCKAFGPTFLAGAALKLFQDTLTFVSPQILRLLIAFVDSNDAMWKGYFYSVLLLATSMVQTIILSQYFQKMFLVGMRVRTALISAIYRKALRVSNAARKESTVGEIVNLMSVDAQRFMDLTSYLNMIWSAPYQIILSMYFLWQILGPSVLAGLAVMIILIPLNAVIANKVKKLQMKQMKYKDERVKLMNEVLSGIKVLKLYAWEPSFQEQVMDIRDKEIVVLKKSAYLNAAVSFVWTCAPFLVAIASFATFVLVDENNVLDASTAFVSLTLFNIMRMPLSVLPMMIIFLVQVAIASFATFILSSDENILDAETAFVSLALFNILRFPLSMLPMLITSMVQTSVSLKRINKFMNAEELDTSSVGHDGQEADPVVLENGTFLWGLDELPVLRNINLKVKSSSLVAVVGSVGSGKSSLLSAILGEMERASGKINCKGRIAYVYQQAWIQNATLQDNILFGKTLDSYQYDNVVEACALRPDLDMLPGGDKTEIGEKGINLSGGQKQRVSLARAVYNDADLYLLDDPLSAVDSHVGKHIFEKVIGPQGLLKKKTRVLVTHGITYLPHMDQIIVLKDGMISEVGTYNQLLEKKGAFADFLLQHLTEQGEVEEENEELGEIKQALVSTIGAEEFQRQVSRQRSRLSESHSDTSSMGDGFLSRQVSRTQHEGSPEKSNVRRRRSSSLQGKGDKDGVVPTQKIGEKLIETEKAETGSVKVDVYMYYLKAVGFMMSIWTIILHLIYQGFSVGSNIWLSVWSNDTAANVTQDTATRDMYLGVYGALGVGQALSSLLGSLVMYTGILTASKILHDLMLTNVLHNPMAFFDTTPMGRIMNRFNKDVEVLDNMMPIIIRGWMYCLFGVIATIAVISYSTPIFLAVILPVGLIYYFVQRFYVATSRQLKRLESVSRSPIYSHFSETITGASTIRAYAQQERFILESEAKVDANQMSYYPSIISNRWLAVRLETVGNMIIFFASLFAVLGRETLYPGLVGLSVSYALQITQTLNWLVRMTCDVETNIVAVERIKEYGETPQEAAWELAGKRPQQGWPREGRVEFVRYQTRYRDGLDLVLKGISCNIEGGEKVGIVGRTGAGKSSLTLALFRIIESAGGSILIDGEDIADLGLHDVRGRLTIIPQDPVLFSGSLRVNLDPFNRYTDVEVWQALEHAHLKSFVKGLQNGLNHEVAEGGENLSVGQRQLVCLARALLRKTKVLILDEATAAVDLETDDLIQNTIRKEFKDCTVLTIAHRLNTIMDSDRVIVLDKGEISEFESPSNLLKNKQSIFYGMARDAGLV